MTLLISTDCKQRLTQLRRHTGTEDKRIRGSKPCTIFGAVYQRDNLSVIYGVLQVGIYEN